MILADDAVAETVKAVARLLVGGTLAIKDAHGVVLSSHPIKGIGAQVGREAWLVVEQAVASAPGDPVSYTATTADGARVLDGLVSMPTIDDGADVVIDPIHLEA